MANKPLIVSSTYLTDSEVRLKGFISLAGLGLEGQTPFVTLVRDDDNHAIDFVTSTFESTTPATLTEGRFRNPMVELGAGSYYFNLDPNLYDTFSQGSYTWIFQNLAVGFEASSQTEFLYTPALSPESNAFGFLDRTLNVCLNEDVQIAYKALTGQTDVLFNIYDPFDQLIVANATAAELDSTGIYRFLFNFTYAGEYIITGSDATLGSSDQMIITVGGSAQRLKTIETLLAQVLQNPPSVDPC